MHALSCGQPSASSGSRARPTTARSGRSAHGSTRGLASDALPSAWLTRASTCSSHGTTNAADVRPSPRPAWSTRRRARRAPDGNCLRSSCRVGTTRGGFSKERPCTPNWPGTTHAASFVNELLCIGAAARRAYPFPRLHAVDDFLDQLRFCAAFAAVDVTLQAEGAQPRLVEVDLRVPLIELHEPDGVAHRCHRPSC